MFQANASEYIGKKIFFDKLEPHILSMWKPTDHTMKPKEEDIK
jgi:hypothetical protein